MKNAFIETLLPGIDNEIDLSSVAEVGAKTEKKGFFKKIFSVFDKKKEPDRKAGLERYRTSKDKEKKN